MKQKAAIGVAVVLLLVSLLAGDALGLVRVGGGIGLVDKEMAPFGRVVLDVLPLWFIALSLDTEYWHFPNRGEVLPFATLGTALIGQATVGAAPVLTISEAGISRNGWALKAGMGLLLGPLGLFAEGLWLTKATAALGPERDRAQGDLRFAVGVTLGF